MTDVLDLLRTAASSPHALTFVGAQPPDGAGSAAASSSFAAQTRSYDDLLRCSRGLASHLAAAEGTKRGDIVLIHAATSHWVAFVAWWACQWLGALPCPLPLPHPDPNRQQAVISHLSALFDKPLVLAARDDMASWDECALRVTTIDGFLCPSAIDLHGEDLPLLSRREHDVAALMLTSGSTALPKAVQLTHANMLAAVRSKAAHLNTDSSTRYLNFIAPDHVANLTEIHLAAMLHGAAQVHVRSADIIGRPLLLLELVDAFAITYTFAPNFLLAQLLLRLDGEHRDGTRSNTTAPSLRTLRVFVSGGEAVPHRTAVRFNELCLKLGAASGPLVAGFGMTETSAGCIYRAAGSPADVGLDNAPVGLAYPGLEVRLLAGDYLAAHDGLETGELILRGPSITRGYLGNAEANAEAFTADGWFRTGDRARISADGVVSLVGRSKEVLNINGVSVACADVQRGIEESHIDGVQNTFTVVCPYRPADAATESYLVAFLPSDPANVLEPVLQVERAAWLAAGHPPLAVLPLDRRELGKSALGKISGARIAGAFAAGLYRDLEAVLREAKRRRLSVESASAKPRSAFETDMAAAVQQVLALADPPSCTASFVELGCSSLALMRMRSAFASILGRKDSDLPVTQLLRHPSIRELAKSMASTSLMTDGASSEEPAEPYDPIVPLSTSGHGTPLFLIHPGVGECLVFLNLAKRFRGERPIFALRARGLGSEPKDVDASGASLTPSGSFARFDDMCKAYAAAIVATQPRGPYAVVGYSFGGVVAFEICKLLEAQGRDVKYTGLLNIPPHISWRMRQLDWDEIAVNLALFLGLVPSEDVEPLRLHIAEKRELRQLSPAALHPPDGEGHSQSVKSNACARVVDLLRQTAPPARLLELGLDARALHRWIDVAADLARSAQVYEPQGKLACAATVFVAVPLAGLGTREEWRRNHLDAWQQYVNGPLRFVDVDGAHYTMLDDAHVESFAGCLRKELKLAGV